MLVRRFSLEDVLDGSHLRAKASPSFRQVLWRMEIWGVSQWCKRYANRIPNCFPNNVSAGRRKLFLEKFSRLLRYHMVGLLRTRHCWNCWKLKQCFFGGDPSFRDATISRCARTVNGTPENRRAFVELMRTNSNEFEGRKWWWSYWHYWNEANREGLGSVIDW